MNVEWFQARGTLFCLKSMVLGNGLPNLLLAIKLKFQSTFHSLAFPLSKENGVYSFTV